MLNLYKISLVVFISIVSIEGKIKKSEKPLPIEVVVNPKNDGNVAVPDTTFLKNKAIELKIRSNDSNDGGNFDLVIEATKQVQATEAKIDRYSPVFNSELNPNRDPANDLKSTFKLNRKWDASRHDIHGPYPIDSTELFPLLMLKQILDTPHPLAGQNQFIPSQNLRHFEDNLHREMMPYQPGWNPVNKLPMHVVVSQPIFTRSVSPNVQNEQPFPQAPQIINLLQNELLQSVQPQNFNMPPHYHQVNSLGYDAPGRGHSENLPATQSGYLIKNHDTPQNNNLLNKSPLQPNSKLANSNLHPKDNVPISQAIHNLLNQNKIPPLVTNQPSYALQRNLQNVNAVTQKQLNSQVTLPRQTDHLHSALKLNNQGSRNYQQNREAQLANYKPIITQQPNQNQNYAPQQRPQQHQQSYHQQPQSGIQLPNLNNLNTYPNNQQYLPGTHLSNLNINPNNYQYLLHQRNVPPTDFNRQNYLRENYRSSLTDSPSYKEASNYRNPTHSTDEHPSSRHHLNNYRNHVSNNQPNNKTPEDDRNIPVYHHSPEGSRPLYYRNPSQTYESPDSQRYIPRPNQSYSRSTSSSTSSVIDLGDHYSSDPERTHRDIYHEPSYESHTRSSSAGSADSVGHSEEIVDNERTKYDDSYVSSKPTKKRKPKKKKIYQTKDNAADLDSHSSHQYIIKIG